MFKVRIDIGGHSTSIRVEHCMYDTMRRIVTNYSDNLNLTFTKLCF